MILKFIISRLFFILALTLSTATADETDVAEEKVIVYNWSDYIPESVLADFTSETNINVDYSTFDSSEIMYARFKLLKGRGYDVIVASTDLVARMRDEGLIQAINHHRLENFKHLDSTLLNQSYDPFNEYSVPYLWGSMGIALNTDKVDIETIKKWEDLWRPQWRGKLLLLDDMRSVFDMALRVNDHSGNSTDPDAIRQAYQRLQRLMPNVKTMSNNPEQAFLNEEVELGMIWNGAAAAVQSKNPAFQYIYPEEGAGFWIDSFVIPARASHRQNALKFIDYMLRPEVAALCVQELGYATPNREAQTLLAENIRNNPVIFPPPKILAKAEFQQDIGKAAVLMKLYWDMLKTSK